MATHTPHATTATELQAVLAAERMEQPFLLHRDEGGELRIVALAEKLTIGRRDTNHVALTWDDEVSRVHCEIECVAGDWTVSDEGLSRNGTFVNEERITGRRRLHDGEVVRVGATRLLFRAPTDETGRTVTTAAKHGETPLSDRQRAILSALARPFVDARGLATPASNREIADELHLGVDAVKGHLRVLYQRFGLDELPQQAKRVRLAEHAPGRARAPRGGHRASPRSSGGVDVARRHRW